uniref:Calmodulin-lysine N-methyltransferase n=1 Tax=Kalanchoe fedtschenkoi TaxID=63787 RepID=A0A7N0UUA4_KALFE
MIPFHLVDQPSVADVDEKFNDACFCYTLPVEGVPKLYLMQRVDVGARLEDFEVCNRYDIDNTGLVCQWPSEDVLAYFCMMHADMFRSKRVIELGSGYGLAGLVVGAASDALERNIHLNSKAIGGTKMSCMTLHWNQEYASSLTGTFDVIIASDCTFFKEFHKGLAQTVKLLLKEGPSEALFFCPNRGDTLDKFLKVVEECGMHFNVTENYDPEVWKRHGGFMNGDPAWPNYAKDHCYPLLVRLTL